MTLLEVLTGIAAVIAGIGGIILVLRELHRRERREADRQIDLLAKQVQLLRSDLVAYHSWAFGIAVQMADAGIEVPPAPVLQPTAEIESSPDPGRRHFVWWWNRRKED